MITRVLGGATRAIGARAASILASFLLTIGVARLLGVEDAGWYFLVSTTLVVLATVGRFGTDLLALRICGGDTKDLVGELTLCAALATIASIATALLAAAVLAVIDFTVPGVPTATLWLVLSAVLPQALAVLAGAVLRGRGMLALGVAAELGSIPLLALVAVLVAETLGILDLSSALVALVIASWLTAAWSVPLAVSAISGSTREARTSVRTFLRERFGRLASMMGASLLFFLLTWIPIYVLSIVSTVSAVSYYSIAARLANLMSLVPSIQVSYLAPAFARLFHTGHLGELNALAARAVRQAAGLLALPAIVLAVAATPLVVLLYGEDFAPAGLPLTILAIGTFAVTLLGQVNQLMLLCGLEHWTLALNAAMVIVWVLLGSWIAAGSGAVGAAWFAAVSNVAYAVIAAVILQRRRGIRSYLRLGRRGDAPIAAG